MGEEKGRRKREKIKQKNSIERENLFPSPLNIHWLILFLHRGNRKLEENYREKE